MPDRRADSGSLFSVGWDQLVLASAGPPYGYFQVQLPERNSMSTQLASKSHQRQAFQSLPPAIIFGGNDNALSLARSLGARRIPVYVLNERRADVQASRYARRLPLPVTLPFFEAATRFLTGSESDFLQGSVLLAASDEALEIIAQHRNTLAPRFRLDLSNPAAQQRMLDKLATYEAARAAGVPTPRFWQLDSAQDAHDLRGELVYPLIVKPKLSHLFQQKFKAKFLVVENFEQLLDAFRVVAAADIEVVLMENIPGPDSLLCSYYTYLDEEGEPQFHFTKRIIRRHPTNMGLACYHITDRVEGVCELALALFRQVGLRGLANAEFKLDQRDGQLKLMECNARFTAANGLVTKAGFDLGSFVYNRLVGLPQERLTEFRTGLRLWDPFRDFQAFRELRQRGELSLFQWLASISHWQMFPAFSWRDPVPGLIRLGHRLCRLVRCVKRSGG